MSRTILVHLRVTAPGRDRRAPATIAGSFKTAFPGKLEIEVDSFELVTEPEAIYTVHPFDDEWIWDLERSGAYPWVTASLQEAVDHANLVRLEHATQEGVDPEWIKGFWSSIYCDDPEAERTGEMIGYVDPLGNYTEGDEPPINENGDWVGESGRPD